MFTISPGSTPEGDQRGRVGTMAGMSISARNSLRGTIKRITHGAVNTEVVVEVADELEVVSIITKESAERLALAEGKEVYVVVKASDVMIAAD